MLLACYSHKHISYRIRTIIRKAIKVQIHDQFIERNHELMETVYRLEERVKNLTEEVNELEAIHKHK